MGMMLSEGSILPKDLKGFLIDPDNKSREVTIYSLCKDQPLILFFYPKNMTPGCTIEVQKFRDSHEEIKMLGATIVGCSKDSDSSHCQFINKHKLPYSLISDSKGEIVEAFGVWGSKQMYGKKYLGIERSTFILKENKIIKLFSKVNVKKHIEEVILFLKEIS